MPARIQNGMMYAKYDGAKYLPITRETRNMTVHANWHSAQFLMRYNKNTVRTAVSESCMTSSEGSRNTGFNAAIT